MQEAQPLISIVLPTYNGSRYISESIDSVLAQTYRNWELIIIDDCSTDDTYEICSSYCQRDDRIRLHRNEHNLKLPASLNRGFRLSSGDLLTWTSDDNRYHEHALTEMVFCLQSHSDIGLVYTDACLIDQDGKDLGYYLGVQDEKLIAVACNIGACFLYRRSVYESIGDYDEGLFTAEDYDYWLRIYCKHSIRRIRKVSYSYRVHSGSLTQSKEDVCYRMSRQAVEKNTGALLSCRPESLGYILVGYAVREWRSGNYARSRSFALRALLVSPGVFFHTGRRVLITAILGYRLCRLLGLTKKTDRQV